MPSSTRSRKPKQRNAIRLLVQATQHHFRKEGRELPWRELHEIPDPYEVFVSEMMLQQTQVERVIPKFKAFIARFPSWESLAEASLQDVLKLWVGLGYNRRAKYLHESARLVVSRFGGVLPSDPSLIGELPGVGPYTARAVATFAFNKRELFIETNIRTVLVHHCFGSRKDIRDDEILPLLEEALKGKRPARWYAALMDYGAHLKRTGIRLNHRSRHYVKQKTFKGSSRELRGGLIRLVLERGDISLRQAAALLKRTLREVKLEAGRLEREGMLKRAGLRLSGSQ